jgi:hypothetical protein
MSVEEEAMLQDQYPIGWATTAIALNGLCKLFN